MIPPERTSGDQYKCQIGVWSLGVSIIELALGRFLLQTTKMNDASPNEDDLVNEDLAGTLSPHQTTPKLPVADKESRTAESPSRPCQPRGIESTRCRSWISCNTLSRTAAQAAGGKFPKLWKSLSNLCLLKDPAKRPTPKDADQASILIEAEAAKVDLQAWVDCMK